MPAACSAGVATAQGTFPADFVVLAAGLGAPALAEPLGAVVPLTHKPGTVNILTPPYKRLLNRILVTGTDWGCNVVVKTPKSLPCVASAAVGAAIDECRILF